MKRFWKRGAAAEDVASQPQAAKDAARSSDVHVVTVNGNKFVSGLFWQPLNKGRTYMAEARELGREKNWDIVAIRKTPGRIQAGFVNKENGALKGMYSLATVLAAALGDSWVGVFDAGDDRYAVVAVHEGAILPGYDHIVVGKDRAKEHAQRALSLGSSESVYAPREFGLSMQELKLADLLVSKNLGREHKLKQLTLGLTRKDATLLAIAIVAIGAGIYGYGQWEEHRDAMRRQELRRQAEERQRRLKALEEQAKRAQPPAALEHPWAKMPSAATFASACKEKSASVPLSVAGWLEEGSVCEHGSLVATYNRGEVGGTAGDFVRFAATYGGTVAMLELTKGTITWSVPMPASGDDPLLDGDRTRTDLVSEVQGWGDDIAKLLSVAKREVELPKPPPPLAGQTTPVPPPPPVPTWQEFTFEFDSCIPPSWHVAKLESLAGFRLTRIETKIAANNAGGSNCGTPVNWNIKGDLYANR